MAKNMEAPFVFGVRVEVDAFTDRREETERLKANFTYGGEYYLDFTSSYGEDFIGG